jgi:hypothetical protein
MLAELMEMLTHTMAYTNGYKYDTEQEAINAQEACNAYYGIPVSPDDITQNWVAYQFAEYDDPQFWYIIYDNSLLLILGEPTEFEVTSPPFPPNQ